MIRREWNKASTALLGTLLLAGCSGPSLTKGSRIGSYASPRTAILIVDVQEDYTGPRAKQVYKDADRILAAANGLIEEARPAGSLVVFIENVVDNPILKVITGGLNAPGAPGTEMDRRLARIPGTRTFTKRESDAFSNPEFDAFLRESQVDHVVITGLDAAICVNATALGALGRGYKVTMHTPGIARKSGKALDDLTRRWREAGAEVR